MSTDALLTQAFTVYPNKRHCNVTLTPQGLTYGEISTTNRDEDSNQVIHFSDIIGCDVENKTISTNKKAAHFTVYSYPRGRKKAKYTGVFRRVKEHVTFVCDEYDEKEGNVGVVTAWMKAIDNMLQSSYEARGHTTSKLLIIINPMSGSRNTLQIFKKVTEPMLKEAKQPYTVLVTERGGHAREYVQSLDLKEWGGIVTISGDGLLHEVINGLMNRADSKDAIQMPLGTLPAGSGNAICSSVNYKAGECYTHEVVLHSTFLLLKHVPQPLDLMKLKLQDGSTVYSCVLLTWATPADVVATAERWRCIGPMRYKLAAVSRILKQNSYKARLSFLPVETLKQTDNNKTDLSSKEASTDANSNEVHTESSRAETYERTNSMCIPALSDPVPENWVTIEEDFIDFSAMLVSHMHPDIALSPSSELDDGFITLVMIKKGSVSRRAMLSMFGSLGEVDENRRQTSGIMEYLKVKAFRLVPLTDEGSMVADGEMIPAGPIQGHVLPSAVSLMAGV